MATATFDIDDRGAAATHRRQMARNRRLRKSQRGVTDEFERTARVAGTVFDRVPKAARTADRGMELLEKSLREVRKELKGIRSASESAAASLKKTGRETGKTGKSFLQTARDIGALIAGLAVVRAGFGELAEGVRAVRTLQSVDRALLTATGSAEAAKEEFSFVRTETLRLGGDLGALAKEYGKLAAATKDSSVLTAANRDIFLAVAEASTALGLSQDDAAGAMRAFVQVASKGRVQAEELRGQLGERIPGAFQLAARSIGVTSAELNKMLELGQVTAERLLPAMAREMRATFGPAAAEAVNEIGARIGRFQTAVFEARVALGEGFTPALGDTLDVTGALLAENEDLIRSVGAGLGGALKLTSTVLILVTENVGTLALTAVATTVAIKGTTVSVTALTVRLGALQAVLAANPLAVLAVAAGAGVAALNSLTEAVGRKLQDEISALVAESNDLRSSIEGWQAAMDTGATEDVIQAFGDADRTARDLRKEADKLRVAMEENADSAGLVHGAYNRIRDELAAVEGQIATTESFMARLNRSVADSTNEAARFEKQMQAVGKAEAERVGDLQKARKRAEEITKSLRTAEEKRGDALREIIDLESRGVDTGDALARTRAKQAKALKAEEMRRFNEAAAETSRQLAEASRKAAELNAMVQLLPVSGIASVGEIGDEAARTFTVQTQIAIDLATILEEILFDEQARLEVDRQIANLATSGVISKEMEAQLRAATGIASQSQIAAEAWMSFAGAVAGALGQIDSKMGDIAKSALDLVESVKNFPSDAGAGSRAVAGFGVGQQAGGIARQFGIGGGPGGDLISGLGGALGGVFGGPLGAVVGGFLGEAISGLFKSGGDDVISTFENIGESAFVLGSRFDKLEGQMEPLGQALADAVIGGFNAVVAAAGGIVSDVGGNIRLKARTTDDGTKFRVLSGETTLLDTLDESAAVARTIAELLKNADIEGLSERFQTAFRNATVNTVDDLERLVLAIAEVESEVEGTGPVRELFRGMRADLSSLRATLVDAGLAASDFIKVENARIAAIRKGITQTVASIIGVEDVAGGLLELQQGFVDFNAELERTTAAREREMQAAEEANAAMAAEPSGTGGLAEGREELMALDREGREFGGGMRDLRTDVTGATVDVEGLGEAMGEIPEALDFEELVDAATVAAARAGQTLVDMIESVRGEGALGIERQELANAAFAIQLAAQIAAVQALIALTELLSPAIRALLQGIVDEGLTLLQEFADGTASLGDLPGAGRVGGGRRQARQQAAESFRDSADDLAAAVAGASESTIAFRSQVEQFKEQAAEARIPLSELTVVLANLAALELREIARPFEEAAAGRQGSGLRASMLELRRQALEALAEATERASENPDAFSAAADAILRGLDAQLRDLGVSALDAFGSPIRSLRRELRQTGKDIAFLINNAEDLGLTLRQISTTVKQATLPGLLAIAEEQARRTGNEELAEQIAARRAKMELRIAQFQFEAAVATLELVGAIGPGIRSLIEEIRPLFDLPTVLGDIEGGVEEIAKTGGLIFGNAARVTGPAPTATVVVQDNRFLAAMEAFQSLIDEFNAISLGPFRNKAEEWIRQIEEFTADAEKAVGIGQGLRGFMGAVLGVWVSDIRDASTEQLEALRAELLRRGQDINSETIQALDFLIAGGGDFDPSALAGMGIQALLDQFAQPLQEAQTPFEALNAEFVDLVDSMNLLAQAQGLAGASAEDLAAAEETFQALRMRLQDELKADIRSLIKEREGLDPTKTNRQRFNESLSNVESLAAAALAGDEGAAAQLADAARDAFSQIDSFLGGGAGAQEANARILELLRDVEAADLGPPLDAQEAMAAALVESASATDMLAETFSDAALVVSSATADLAAIVGPRGAEDGMMQALSRIDRRLEALEAGQERRAEAAAQRDAAKMNVIEGQTEVLEKTEGNTATTAQNTTPTGLAGS